MHLAFTKEQDALREELRAYFEILMTPERRAELTSGEGEYGGGEAYREIVRQLGADGWLTLGWPVEYGGQARSVLDQLIFTDEAATAGVPVPFLTINTVGPTIMRFGTPEQREFFLPRIARGELHFAIGYSEPEAGTDLASLRTRAERVKGAGEVGGEYVVNGQKMWTSLIQFADYVWLAARTDPDAPPHKGISVLIVPTDSPGFSWTPVRTVAGVGTSATYYSDVRVPVTSLVGEENRGWALITNQLNHERVALTSAAPIFAALREVTEWARETGAIEREWVRVHLARVHAKAEFLKLLGWRIAAAKDGAGPGPAAASANKVFGTEFATEAYRLLMEVLGPASVVRTGSPGALIRGRIERMHRAALILTFGGGTNEVQRDIIAAAALGLPISRR
ncbi:acyl-CoA dehydrogenase family protein [Pseudonocardia eucalypti]|uniref:Acyl-CoA dehydrogenase family protein n=1 Tax=Pseudonocardia eucalypti TaxID=648755 RepID=A0ABP9QYF1_9PSEU|nr:alkylation response protein AidB-like acyl-CoA dehydrogenase [Pseudonocardia eucalypti]